MLNTTSFKCNSFVEHRWGLFRSTRSFHPLNTNKLFYGVEGKSDVENKNIFSAIHHFIKSTDRIG